MLNGLCICNLCCIFADNTWRISNMSTDPTQLQMPSSSATIRDRIRYLIRLTRHTQAEFARLLGVDPANVSRVLGSKSEPSESFINRIVVNLNVSKEWLLNGSDVPFPRHDARREVQSAGAPVYNIDVTAGSVPLSRMFTDERIIGRMKLPGLNPDYPIVRVSGSSMEPRIMPGSYISIRPIALDSPISWGSIYVIVLADYRLVKYVRRNADPSLVTLHSANPDYDDIEIARSDIEGLYLVENIISHDLLA